MNNIEVKVGDCLDVMKEIPDKSVHCCVTSPPYWGLRDYGNDDQLGLEKTPEGYVENMVKVFREVKRVLRDDGTLWLNLGDSYAGDKNGNTESIKNPRAATDSFKKKRPANLKPKDLVGIPWRVAFALQKDGWYLRQDIIWHKPNPMPESVRDRCTKAHEYIFLLSKKAKYYFDGDAIAEDFADERMGNPGNSNWNYGIGAYGHTQRLAHGWNQNGEKSGRNKRSVWTVTTKPYSGAHFAVFPPDLIEPCIKAGSPEFGTVLDPFGGAGTTGLVCSRLNRNAILCELNPEYAELARERIRESEGEMFTRIA